MSNSEIAHTPFSSRSRKSSLTSPGRKIAHRFITYKDLEKAQAQLCCARKRSYRPRMRVIPSLLITETASLEISEQQI
jgi:hypothetical protein